MSDQPPTDGALKPGVNIPRMSNPADMSNLVPPGMGELNYIQMLLAGLLDQALYTTSTPTFVSTILTGLTASQLVATSATKQLESASVGSSLQLSGGTLNTIQGISTADSPTFTNLTLSGLTASLPVSTTSGKVLQTQTVVAFRTLLGLGTADGPTLASLLLSSSNATWSKITLENTSQTAKARFNMGANNAYFNFNAYWTGSAWASDNASLAPLRMGLHSGSGYIDFAYSAAGAVPSFVSMLQMTNTGKINVMVASTLGLIDSNSTHYLRLNAGSDLTADRILTLTTGDAARTITLSGDPTLADWFDQSVKQAASPTFTGLTINSPATSGDAIALTVNSLAGGTGLHITTTSEGGGDLILVQATQNFLGDLLAFNCGSLMTGRGFYFNGGTGSNPQMRIEGGTRTGTTIEVLQSSSGTSAITCIGNLLITSSKTLGLTGTRVAKGWFTDLEISGYPTVGGTSVFDQAVSQASSPTFAGITIGSLAGIIKGASGVLSALALGTADLKLFMNAAGTDIEFASGIKIGYFTYDLSTASGTQAITGVGFKPSHIIFIGGTGDANQTTIGIDNGTTKLCHYLYTGSFYVNTNFSIASTPGASDYQTGLITTLGSDGFTLTWTKTGSPTGTLSLNYLAFR